MVKYTAEHTLTSNNPPEIAGDPIAARIVDSDSKIDNTCQPQPTRHHWRGVSRDLLLLALSIISFKLTTPPYRGPNGTSFARPSFDQPLSALSILIVKLTTLAFRNPRGTTGAVLRVTYCCSHCRLYLLN